MAIRPTSLFCTVMASFALAPCSQSILAESTASTASTETTQHISTPPTQYEKGPLPLDDLRAFTEVLQRIKSSYVEPIDDKSLLENAIRGMLDNLDPHSAYLKKEDYKDLEESTSGEFGGLGIEVSGEDGLIKVITPIDGTPAHSAGIKAGDLIIELNDTPIRGLGLKKSVELMRGPAGEPITLTIIREDAPGPLEITVVREIIKVNSVRHLMLEKGLGYIRISQFQVDTGKEVQSALNEMRNKDKLNGVILDLRNNPGGVLQAAVEVSDLFLKNGLIVYTKGRITNSNYNYNATKNDPSLGVPLVVMINGGSASASEIVAGALQDHRRGIVVGTKSFGKGSVQTVLPLSTDSERGLKLTTALYYTPNGRSIQAEGIVPDITVDNISITLVKESGGYREANLQNHLDNSAGEATSKNDNKGADNDLDNSPAVTDYQLHQALNILKSLHLYNQQFGIGQNMATPPDTIKPQ